MATKVTRGTLADTRNIRAVVDEDGDINFTDGHGSVYYIDSTGNLQVRSLSFAEIISGGGVPVYEGEAITITF